MTSSTASPSGVAGISDTNIVRELAARYAELCADPDQHRRREDWRRHNSLERVPGILIFVRAFAWSEMPESRLQCEDPLLRNIERQLRMGIFRSGFRDDFVLEPWVTVDACLELPGKGIWGPPLRWTENRSRGGAGVIDPPVKRLEDIDKIVPAHHRVDEVETARRFEKSCEAIGDLVVVNLDRGPAYRSWAADISTHLAQLRGLEQLMWDMYDNPEWLHRVLARMRDGILRNQEEAERAGDWRLCNHDNQAVSYCRELPDPAANSAPVSRSQLWFRAASQELTLVGPEQFEEFMLRYQQPIMANFGLVAWGCCEEMTSRIPLLKRVPNMRRIAVTPVSDAAKCAELIGDGYVASYRPSPADMVSYRFDEGRIRGILKRDLEAFRANGCFVDITLKDVETVEGDTERVTKWVALVRRIVEELS